MVELNSTAFFKENLEDFNDKEVDRSLLAIVYLIIVLIIGITGNFIVLVIYGKSFKRYVYKYIVWNLALVDLTFCTVGIPFNIARLFHYYTFSEDWACKVFVALINLGLIYSANLLLLLSLHRFRKICTPIATQLTVSNVRFLVLGCFCFASIVALPQFALEEIEYVDLGYNVTGKSCPIASSNPSVYWIVRNSILLCLFVFYTVVLVIIYTSICKTLCVRRQELIQQENSPSSVQGLKDISNKMTKIAFAISVVFTLSYFPLFTLKVMSKIMDKSKIRNFEHSMLRLVARFYFLNHVANPLIYIIFDSSFRKRVTLLAPFKILRVSTTGTATDKETYYQPRTNCPELTRRNQYPADANQI